MKDELISEIKIFYVEDELLIREGFVRFLRRRTDNIFAFENGQQALDAFDEQKPDLIITDIRMPVMDGLKMAEQIRLKNPTIPIIVTTGHNDEDFFLKSIDLSVDKYIKKPINFTELIEIIKKISSSIIYEKQIEQQRNFLKEVMDLNPNFIITTNGKRCTYLNKSFKDYLGVESVEEYIDKYDNINNVLVHREGLFYSGRPVKEWVNDTIREHQENRMVVMKPKDPEKPESTYLMNIKPVPDKNEWLFSFADVTSLEKEKQIYRMLSQQDPLTKIYNRKKFFEEVDKELERVFRYGQDLSVLMFDVDFFKAVNDKYGHLVGDSVLIEMTEIVRKNIRKTDVFARYGGEEFALLMPGTDIEGAKEKADNIREAISSFDFHKCGQVTCSFGVADCAEGDTVDSFVQKADIALYKAKDMGRNNVQIFEKGSFECTT